MGLIFLRNKVSGGAAFDPASLFASGEQGVWYDPSDLTTMWTDTAGTTQTTAVLEGVTPTSANQVARIDDKSGNGNHALQGTSPDQPILRVTSGGLYYLEFNGTNDDMATAAINFTSTDEMSVFAGVRKPSDAVGIIAELGTTFLSQGGWSLSKNTAPSTTYSGRGARVSAANDEASVSIAAPETGVYTAIHSINDGLPAQIRRNAGSWQYSVNTNFGGGNFGNHPLHIGARNSSSFWFDGNLYGLIVRGALSDATEISGTETYLANRSGVTL